MISNYLYLRSALQIGQWSSEIGLNLTDAHSLNIYHNGVPNLMVVTIEEPPYVMVKCHNCSGNDRYEGFAIDLLNSLSSVSCALNKKSDMYFFQQLFRLLILSTASTLFLMDCMGSLIMRQTSGMGLSGNLLTEKLISQWHQ